MMFFRTLAGLFRGFSVYQELVNRHPVRAFFHLLLWCILLALLVSALKLSMVSGKITRLGNAFTEDFGEITITQRGMLPEKSPALAREFYLPGNLRFDYLTPDRVPVLKDLGTWKQHAGIFWTPRGFLLWIRVDSAGKVCMVFPVPMPDTEVWLHLTPEPSMGYHQLSPANLEKFIGANYFLKEDETLKDLKPGTFSFASAVSLAKAVFFTSTAFSAFFSGFLLAFITALLFALMQMLWKTPGTGNVRFGGMFSVMAYASFLPLAAAALSMVFIPSYVSYETVYFIVFFICQLYAFNVIRRNSGSRGGEQNRE